MLHNNSNICKNDNYYTNNTHICQVSNMLHDNSNICKNDNYYTNNTHICQVSNMLNDNLCKNYNHYTNSIPYHFNYKTSATLLNTIFSNYYKYFD